MLEIYAIVYNYRTNPPNPTSGCDDMGFQVFDFEDNSSPTTRTIEMLMVGEGGFVRQLSLNQGLIA
jgi:hypothetical protein